MLGIAKYANLYTNWVLQKNDPFYRKTQIASYKYLLKKQFDGIFIAGELYEKWKPHFKNSDTPLVISAHYDIVPGKPNVVGNWEKNGRMAAEHLLSCGLKNFGFCGFSEFCWSRSREEGFLKAVKEAGHSAESIHLKPKLKTSSEDREYKNITDWLKSLPKPAGIMACNDDLGKEILEICKMADLKVPDEIAVIGSDNDQLICNLCHPTLTSIDNSSEKAGYDAARIMDNIMNGREKMGEKNIVVEPLRIVTRQSTNTLAIGEPNIINAINFIRQNAFRPITVQEVADATYVSKRVLQRKFKKYLDRSIHYEILKTRYELVEKALLETNMSISQIAKKLKFSGDQNLARFFKKMRGITPREFRNKQVPNQ